MAFSKKLSTMQSNMV